MAEETNSNESQTDDGLAKYADSNLQALQDEKLTREQWVEKSWEFLTAITDEVEKLPKDVQDKILEAGRELAKAGGSYNHDDKRPFRPPVSPAKIAALKELKAKSA